jgi:hypothetical protein
MFIILVGCSWFWQVWDDDWHFRDHSKFDGDEDCLVWNWLGLCALKKSRNQTL